MLKKEKFTKCPTCGEIISKNDKMCPHCNAQIKNKKSIGKLVVIWVCVIIGVSLLISGITGSLGDDGEASTDTSSQEASQKATADTQENNNVSMGQRMALESAKNYLRTMGFSKKGLISQLEFEGYTTSEATYAVNNCGANWKEQAVRVAKNYLNTMSFSRQGLIDQLEFEGFTSEEAAYGVEIAYK